jgi:ubiquinone/menaquinone biosynthesis C-methylase UbiE
MKGKMPNIAFRIMAHVAMPIRNRLMQPAKMFEEIEIQKGQHVLDFGCGPGLFSFMAAEATGPSGMVYALDIHPLAIKMVSKKSERTGVNHIKTILSGGGPVPIEDSSLDVILCIDVFHMLEDEDLVLEEWKRVLKPKGNLYFSDHHMKPDQVLDKLAESGGFQLKGEGQRALCFALAPEGNS